MKMENLSWFNPWMYIPRETNPFLWATRYSARNCLLLPYFSITWTSWNHYFPRITSYFRNMTFQFNYCLLSIYMNDFNLFRNTFYRLSIYLLILYCVVFISSILFCCILFSVYFYVRYLDCIKTTKKLYGEHLLGFLFVLRCTFIKIFMTRKFKSRLSVD